MERVVPASNFMNSNYPPPRFDIGQRVILNDYAEDDFTGEATPGSIAGEVHGLVYSPSWGMSGWYYFVRFDNNISDCLHESFLSEA